MTCINVPAWTLDVIIIAMICYWGYISLSLCISEVFGGDPGRPWWKVAFECVWQVALWPMLILGLATVVAAEDIQRSFRARRIRRDLKQQQKIQRKLLDQ